MSASAARGLYKRLMGVARVRPNAVSEMDEVRKAFRASAGVRDPDLLAKLVKEGESKLAFLKMTTPRYLLPKPLRGESGVRRWRYDGSAVVEGGATSESTAHSNGIHRIHETDVSRHKALMDRMHFKGPKWE